MSENLATGYKGTYELFDSPLMRQIRSEAYDEDIGQHSWVTASELRSYLPWLDLFDSDTFLDFGCGPGGPLTFLAQQTGASAVGIDLSGPAIAVGVNRVQEMELAQEIEFHEVDGNQPISFSENTFDLIVSFDVVLHLQKREPVFAEWRRILKPGGKLLFTDAGIITGPVTNQDINLRSINGYTQFVPKDFNQRVLEEAGFELVDTEDQSAGPVANASGRIKTGLKYRKELLELVGQQRFEQEQQYLEAVVALYERKALSRFAYRALLK